MTAVSEHPSRSALRKAARTGSVPFRGHLDVCEACRIEFELLCALPRTALESIEQPGREALKRFSSIPLLAVSTENVHHRYGRISFDSWAARPALQVRDLHPGTVRRLCLKAGKVSVEIVAERLQDCWEFTARVYETDGAVTHWVMKAGGKCLMPRSLGFYHWSAGQAPRTIRLLSDSIQIDFEKISWA